MAKVLIAYYPSGETTKVAERFNLNFKNINFKSELKEIKLIEDLEMRKQFKREKKLKLLNEITSLSKYDLIIVGTPIVAFTSVPAVNAFIRSLPKFENKKVILYATGIGLPGKAVKKMSSLFSMNGGKVIGSKVFSSIFDFDEKKLKEVDVFFETLKKEILSKNKNIKAKK